MSKDVLEDLEKLTNKLKETYLCKHYKDYDYRVQKMVENIYKATNRINLYDSQKVYIMDEALKVFEKKKGK